VWAWLVHGEIPGATALIGYSLIFSSVLLQALRKDPTRALAGPRRRHQPDLAI